MTTGERSALSIALPPHARVFSGNENSRAAHSTGVITLEEEDKKEEDEREKEEEGGNMRGRRGKRRKLRIQMERESAWHDAASALHGKQLRTGTGNVIPPFHRRARSHHTTRASYIPCGWVSL